MPQRQPAPAGTGHTETARNPWLILLSVALGLFMVVLDISILNIALPAISSGLHATLAAVEWTLIIYTLALTALVPFFGRVSDVMGRRRLFIIGMMIFSGASLLAAFSQSIMWLIGARLIQAFGGALITANVLAIITDVFPAGKRGTAMGVQAILISGGASMGPIIGGFLVTHFGWQSVFLVNVPIGIVASIMGFFILPQLKSNRAMEPIDWLGSGLLLGGLTPLLLGVTEGPEWNWSLTSIILIVVGIVGIALFIIRELRARYPLLDLTLFKIKEFAAGQAAGMFATIALSTMTLLFPFYWQVLRGYSAETTGIYMLPMPLTLMVFAPLAGRFSDKLGARGISSTGLALIGIGLFLISQVTATMPVWHVLWRLMLFGAGLGMFTAPNNNAVMSSAPPQRRGVASGLLGMFRYSGQSFGIAFAGTVFVTFATAGTFALHSFPSLAQAATADATAAGVQDMATAFMNGMHATALLAIPFAVVGIFLSLLRGKHQSSEHESVAAATEASFD